MTSEETTDADDRETTRNDARHDADGRPTEHPTGDDRARQNAEEELPG